MKKNLICFFSFIVSILLVYTIQLYVIDNREIFGVKPNLILVMCIIITLFGGIYKGTILSFIIGLFTDILFGTKAIFTIGYTLTSLIIGFLVSDYNKNDTVFIVAITFISTILFEIFEYIIYASTSSVFSDLFYLIKQILISSVLNIVIVFFAYKVVYAISDYFDVKFKTHNIS